MRTLFNPEGPLMETLRKIMYMLLLNMIFLICCLPVITIGPAVTSLYYAIQKTLKYDRSYPIKEYFACFKKNFKQSALIGVILTLIFLIFVMDSWILEAAAESGVSFGNTFILFEVLKIIVLLYAVWNFGYVARFQNTIPKILKNSSILMIRHLGWTFVIFVIGVLGTVAMMLLPILICICPVIMVWFVMEIMEKIFVKYMTAEDKEKEALRTMDFTKIEM